jgi:hypothetical protein
MAGGFGFQNYGSQRKTPSSEAVGQALMQRGQDPGLMAPAEQPFGMGQQAAPPSDQALREDGARRMGGAGQIDDNASEDDDVHSANAVNVAIGEALTRAGGGYATSPNRFRDEAGKLRQLQQLGLSQVEAQLLLRTGGL